MKKDKTSNSQKPKTVFGIMQNIKLINGEEAKLIIRPNGDRHLISENYKFDASGDVKSGYARRYGKTLEEDADLLLGLPEIADIEISEVCSAGCKFCYKRNTVNGRNMSFDTFVEVFKKLPKTITQIAFGIGDLPMPIFDNDKKVIGWEGGNSDMWKIFEYCRKNLVMTNLTINGFRMTEEAADMLVKYCGAVAVSIYDKESSYNAVKMLTDRGMNQINIHYFLSEETYDRLFELFEDTKNDPRLNKLNAIVLLSLKKKGRAVDNNYNSVSMDKFKHIIDYAFENDIRFGFDSCTAQKVTKSTINGPHYERIKNLVEPCESTLYSMYINAEGIYYPCSFTEGEINWQEGIDVKTCNDFLTDVWYNERTVEFKNKCIECREKGISCPAGYEI